MTTTQQSDTTSRKEARAEAAAHDERRKEVGTKAAENILGPNPVVGLRGKDILQTFRMLTRQALRQPHQVFAHGFTFAAEASRILGGSSELAPDPKDRRFQDTTWNENGIYQRGLQLYLSANKEVHDWVDASIPGNDDRKRAHFVLSLFTDALAPSNSVFNPEALKRLLETGGTSGVHGIRHLLDDLQHNGGMPSQVDKSAFKVGENLATTSGAVVFRNEVLELIQYQPVTREVSERPLLVVPPQIKQNLLPVAGKLTVCGTPIDISQVDCDFYDVGGVTDHIVPWESCYHSSLLLGKREFILSNSGHIQSILNPPGNPKATFFTNTERSADAKAWFEGATKQNGSWWEHWKAWLLDRSGSQKEAPAALGNNTYRPMVESPGTYVYE
jgi:Poly-beta-hydroxybutyrate polymerase (PhaC) N-terminus